jgi:hypothetical protein
MLKQITLVALLVALAGCAGGRPSLIPNPDKNLRKASAQFAADAAVRHPYKTAAPRGGEAIARSQVGYSLDRLDVVNLSDQAWQDVEIWVNQKYVVHLPKVEPNTLKIINFQMLYDAKGNYFPTNNNKTLISKVEVFKDGKMYDLPVRLGD